MKTVILVTSFICILSSIHSQDFTSVDIDSEITEVQPMTGIVFWPGNGAIETDAISLEYSYMLYNDIVKEEGVYDWSPVEELLEEIAGRNHQAVLRFRFSYPGYTTSVPDYIKALPDYVETEGTSESRTTWFPDWTHPELMRFTLEFYEKYAEKYDSDRRLAFVQTGFGLWAEYHIYDGPFRLGETFPSKEFQETFFKKLEEVFVESNWSISIDAASSTYSPFEEKPALKSINFGLFDDSFMHSGHSGYNTTSWNFFDRERYKTAPAGGEFSYYTTYDQQNVLNEHIGAHGTPFEEFVEEFKMSYINGNDQNKYQSLERIKQASMYMGYRYKINSFLTKEGLSEIEVENVGVAPIYYDAFVAVNGVRSTETLLTLYPGEKKIYTVNAGGENATVTIESDRILETQKIQYYGTINTPYVYVKEEVPTELSSKKNDDLQKLIVQSDQNILRISSDAENMITELHIYNLQGKTVFTKYLTNPSYSVDIPIYNFNSGLFIIKTTTGNTKWIKK